MLIILGPAKKVILNTSFIQFVQNTFRRSLKEHHIIIVLDLLKTFTTNFLIQNAISFFLQDDIREKDAGIRTSLKLKHSRLELSTSPVSVTFSPFLDLDVESSGGKFWILVS